MKGICKIFLFFVFAINAAHAIVLETKEMRDVIPYVTNESLVFFDIGNTIIGHGPNVSKPHGLGSWKSNFYR